MTINFFTIPDKKLAANLSASGSTFSVNNLEGWDGTALTASDFGTIHYVVFRNSTNTAMELCEIDPTAMTATSITLSKRGLKFNGDTTTQISANKLLWVKGDTTVSFGSNPPQLYQWLKEYIDGIAISGSPDISTTTKGIAEEATTAEIDAGTATGGTGAELMVNPNKLSTSIYNTRLPTANEKAGLVALSGTTPSATNLLIDSLALTGMILPYVGKTAPTGFLLADGTAVSRSTYSALFAVLCPSATFTVTVASPAVFSATAHGLVAGDALRLTTTGALPTGLAAGTTYYVISAGLTADAFEVSTSRGGGAVNTTGTQSGVHTWQLFNAGVGDGSTTFNLPNLKGKSIFGYDVTDANFDTLNTPNTYVGEKTHVLTEAELAAHTHGGFWQSNSGGGGSGISATGGLTSTSAGLSQMTTASGGSNTAHNNMPPYLVCNFIIKT